MSFIKKRIIEALIDFIKNILYIAVILLLFIRFKSKIFEYYETYQQTKSLADLIQEIDKERLVAENEYLKKIYIMQNLTRSLLQKIGNDDVSYEYLRPTIRRGKKVFDEYNIAKEKYVSNNLGTDIESSIINVDNVLSYIRVLFVENKRADLMSHNNRVIIYRNLLLLEKRLIALNYKIKTS